MIDLDAIRRRVEEATAGPWVVGSWTIFPEDRAAQSRREPYWTLIVGQDGDTLTRGPLGRKAMDPDAIVHPLGFDAEGIALSSGDREFIIQAREDVPAMLELIEKLKAQLAHYETEEEIAELLA